MVLTGYVRRIDAHLSPAEVINPVAVDGGDPALLAAACLAEVDQEFALRVGEGDLLVINGALEGDGDPELALEALQAVGIAAIVCRHAAVEIVAVADRYGLPIVCAPEAVPLLHEGTLFRLDLERGLVEGAGARWEVVPLVKSMLDNVRRVQLLARMRRVVEEEGFAE
jgi:3-isopropylmalate/(R)-2-methylmalate dehydratase small subunit